MIMTPFLDLRHIAIDPLLVQQLPLGLARYYEAIPIGREGESVTVAMSHPDNVTALAVLTQLFHAEIVPIRTDGAALRAALQQLYAREPVQPHGVLAWLSDTTRSVWASMLAQDAFASEEMPLTWLDAGQMDAETLLAAARGSNYQLTLCALSTSTIHAALLREIHAPLWLTPAEPVLPQRILLVLRGFASDEIALSWVLRLSQQPNKPAVSLLPIMGQSPWGALSYLQQPGQAQNHIANCATRLAQVDIQPMLTLQSGEPRQQVAQATRDPQHDLMVIAAEGHGQFVSQLLTDMEERDTWPRGGVLVVKPSHEQTQRLSQDALIL
jgi:hypothetical protein